jgi:hypothetical protein
VLGHGHAADGRLAVHLGTGPIGSHGITLDVPLPLASTALTDEAGGLGYAVDVAPLGRVSAVMTFTTPPARRVHHRHGVPQAVAAQSGDSGSSSALPSVVPVGPTPVGELRPKVAAAAGHPHALARASTPITNGPALSPLAVGLALMVVAALFAARRLVAADARVLRASPRR